MGLFRKKKKPDEGDEKNSVDDLAGRIARELGREVGKIDPDRHADVRARAVIAGSPESATLGMEMVANAIMAALREVGSTQRREQVSGEIGRVFASLTHTSPRTADLLLKSIVAGAAMALHTGPREVLEHLASGAPTAEEWEAGDFETAPDLDANDPRPKPEDIAELEQLFRLPSADEPTPADAPDEKKPDEEGKED